MKIRPVSHEDQLTLVQHLDELRWRIIVSLAAFALAFALCFWQNHLLFDLLNNPLPGHRRPVTLGVAEPFFTTVTVSAYAAIVLALPVVLYQVYAFVLPAFEPSERRVLLPLLLMVPVLLAAGVVFGYFVVLPAALKFLLNFNQSQFNIQIRAREYYSFAALTLVALGILFQIPVAVVGATRLGLVTPRRLRQLRRHAIVAIAVIAMLLPGTDPVTMLLSMAPLVLLYELSILLASLLGRPARRTLSTEPAAEGPRYPSSGS
jgi:sec-independent protein translocase protein TatC